MVDLWEKGGTYAPSLNPQHMFMANVLKNLEQNIEISIANNDLKVF
jgi:hypothetical protein